MTVIMCMKTGCPHHSGPGGVCKKPILMLNEDGTCIEALRKRVRNRKPYVDPDTIRVVEL